MRALCRCITLVFTFIPALFAGLVVVDINMTLPDEYPEAGFGSVTIGDIAAAAQADFRFDDVPDTATASHNDCPAGDTGSGACSAYSFTGLASGAASGAYDGVAGLVQGFGYQDIVFYDDVAGRNADAALLIGLASAAADLDVPGPIVPDELVGFLDYYVPEPKPH